ncbi:MAG TPA: site-specific integrase [Thermoanaerobaculia bacterium]|nr:site-specific integrase [Thermoanaerobaculia bacterium]
MPKKVRVDLSSRRSREKLPILENATPHWHQITAGRSLGYRRLSPGGTWSARFYLGGGKYLYGRLGLADDVIASDGVEVLDYSEAVRAAIRWCDSQEGVLRGAELPQAPYTVAESMADYLDWYRVHRKSYDETRLAIQAHILPELGSHKVETLTTRRVRLWHQALATSPARLRPGKGRPGRIRPIETTEHARRRKATANRVLTVLKAALNMAVHEGRVSETVAAALRTVRPFKGVDAPRIRFFDRDEIGHLLHACDPDFQALVVGALLTGCRYGELVGMRVEHYLPASRALQVPEAKGGSSRIIFLNDEGVAYFEAQVAGRQGSEPIFLRADRQIWGRSHQERRMRGAAQRANLQPPASFHILRHTYASHYLMAGGSLPGLARQLGHSDVRMTLRSYAHLANAWRAAEAQQHGLRFGVVPGPRLRDEGHDSDSDEVHAL